MALLSRSVLSTRSVLLITSINLKNVFHPARHFKSALKIKWEPPERVPSIKPECSGDLAPLGTLDMTQFPSTHKDSKELQSADEIVKRLHTLEFFNRKTLKEEFMTQYANRVKAHQLDDDSPEVKLAKMTAKIRNLQIHMDKYHKDVKSKVRLKETIDKRNKYLTQLRNSDYKKFEWLLEKLDIIHKVYAYNGHDRVERKKSLRRLTMLYIVKLKNEKLTEYKILLETQKEGFLKDKLEKFIWIKTTEEKHGLSSSISDADIEAIRSQLKNLQITTKKEVVE